MWKIEDQFDARIYYKLFYLNLNAVKEIRLNEETKKLTLYGPQSIVKKKMHKKITSYINSGYLLALEHNSSFKTLNEKINKLDIKDSQYNFQMYGTDKVLIEANTLKKLLENSTENLYINSMNSLFYSNITYTNMILYMLYYNKLYTHNIINQIILNLTINK